MSTRHVRQLMKKENARRPMGLVPIPKSKWPEDRFDTRRIGVWRSREFLVQAFDEGEGVIRLSVNRTTLLPDGNWADGISWDDLQRLKGEAGFGDAFAVEIYPENCNVVNVSNMRHLWILLERLPFAWSADG